MKKYIYLFSVLAVQAAYAQSGQSAFKPVYISKVPKPKAPPALNISDVVFSDAKGNNNQMLDAEEAAEITFKVKNSGSGDAYYVKIIGSASGKTGGISFPEEQTVEQIAPGSEKNFVIPLKGSLDIETGKVNFTIVLKEGNGFDADPFKITFNTQKFRNPKLAIPDYLFSNNEAEGKLKAGQTISLKLIIQNQGQGTAKNINVKFKTPENVFPANQSGFIIQEMKPNESKTLLYEFFANKQYNGQLIPIEITATESQGKFGIANTLSVSLDQSLSKTRELVVDAKADPTVQIVEPALVPDVDKNIPLSTSKNDYRFALVIGNENYSGYQQGLNDEANVEFARNDARVFKQYCVNTLGIPEENITYLTDATAARMRQGIDKMNKLLKNSEGKAEIIFYYAGHGLPDEKSRDSYIVPVDVSGNDLQSAISLKSIYSTLTEFPAKRVTVFLDACFSGGGRNEGLVASRSVKVTPRSEMLKGSMLVFAACSGDQVSLPYKARQHGMFTYYLLKALQESKGEMSYNELSAYLKSRVGLESVNINNKEQNPQFSASEEMKKELDNLRMR